MKRALGRHERGKAVAVPVILRDCDWKTAPFGRLQALPKDVLPVKLWPDRDSAWKDVAQGNTKSGEKNETLTNW